jgi:hypothetical protein
MTTNTLYLYVIIMFFKYQNEFVTSPRAPAESQFTGLKRKMSALSKYLRIGAGHTWAVPW